MRLTTAAALALGLALAVPAQAQAPLIKPARVVGDVVKLTATVDGVDQARRIVTLKGPDGKSKTLKVDRTVKNFDHVKVGDNLTAEYIDAVAVFVRKAGTPPAAAEAGMVEVAPKGEKPKAIAVETTEMTAAVENINYDQRLVTLRDPAGNAGTLRVDQRVENLRQVNVGDELVIRRTEALAIAMTKP